MSSQALIVRHKPSANNNRPKNRAQYNSNNKGRKNGSNQAYQQSGNAKSRNLNSHYSASEIIELVVGEEEEIFRVHKNLLCDKSAFFRAGLASAFVEAQNNQFIFQEDPPFAVSIFVDWLYSGKVTFEPKRDEDHVPVFLFAYMICSEQYQNDLMDSVRHRFAKKGCAFMPSTILKIYKSDLRDFPIARFGLLSTVFWSLTSPASYLEGGHLAGIIPQWHKNKALVQDYITEVLEYHRRPYANPSIWTGCHFHEHKDGSECPAMMPNTQIGFR